MRLIKRETHMTINESIRKRKVESHFMETPKHLQTKLLSSVKILVKEYKKSMSLGKLLASRIPSAVCAMCGAVPEYRGEAHRNYWVSLPGDVKPKSWHDLPEFR